MTEHSCSFCGKTRDEVKILIVKKKEPPSAGICEACIFICVEIIFSNLPEKLLGSSHGPVEKSPDPESRIPAESEES